MIRPVNIYTLSRIRDGEQFEKVKHHCSRSMEHKKETGDHEIESLRKLANEFKEKGLSVADMDGFFFSFVIPQIEKEFDLLRFTDGMCLNIELKSRKPDPKGEKIRKQLMRNRYYLGHLEKQLMLYTVVTDEMKCYTLADGDELKSVDLDEIIEAVGECGRGYSDSIDELFRPSDYLVSPLNDPDLFIEGKYFLTDAQETIRKTITKSILDADSPVAFFHLTGKPGTGKTLVLYDLAKALSEKEKTLIIHCGQLSRGQKRITEEVEELDIISAKDQGDLSLKDYRYILVDETHRIYPDQFETICESVRNNDQVCIFSSDPEQILSIKEKEYDIVDRIKEIPSIKEFKLTGKIRTNRELYSFVDHMINLNLKKEEGMDYSNVELNYANTTEEAQSILKYYREKEYRFINYSKSNYKESPYEEYLEEEDYDTHGVVGQEFDKVVMLMDSSFFYDEKGLLQGVKHPNPDYLYPNLFYQGATRAREQLAIIVVENRDLFAKAVSVF